MKVFFVSVLLIATSLTVSSAHAARTPLPTFTLDCPGGCVIRVTPSSAGSLSFTLHAIPRWPVVIRAQVDFATPDGAVRAQGTFRWFYLAQDYEAEMTIPPPKGQSVWTRINNSAEQGQLTVTISWGFQYQNHKTLARQLLVVDQANVAVPAPATCPPPIIGLSVAPRHPVAGKRAQFRVTWNPCSPHGPPAHEISVKVWFWSASVFDHGNAHVNQGRCETLYGCTFIFEAQIPRLKSKQQGEAVTEVRWSSGKFERRDDIEFSIASSK